MRFPWTKRPEPEPEPEPTVTIADIITAWPLWLAAGRPPFEWFMAMDFDVQDALAEIGMKFSEARDMELAVAIANPQLADAAVLAQDDPSDQEASATVLQHILAEAAGRLTGAPEAAPEAPSSAPTWGGLAKTQAAAEERRRAAASGDGRRVAVSLPGGD